MTLANRTTVELIYENTNITADVAGDLLSLTYTDNEHGKADDISLRLKDDHGLWSGPWLPQQGDTITAAIIQQIGDETRRLNCGRFTIDEIESDYPPSIVDLKGVSVPLDTSIRRLPKSKGWESTSLSEIAQEIASNGSIELQYLVDEDPRYDRVDQHEESDLKFLQRLCEQESYSVKVTDLRLIIFSSEQQELTSPVQTIVRGGSNLLRRNFKTQSHDLYQSVTLSYFDSTTGEVNEYTYTDPNVSNGRTTKLVQRAASIEEAERRARAVLRNRNRMSATGNMGLVGDTRLVTGATIQYSEGSKFDGKYLINKATHTVGSGYVVALELTKAEEGA
jgi:phage protein D